MLPFLASLTLAAPAVEIRSATPFAHDRILSDPHMAQEQGLVATLETDEAWLALVVDLELGLDWTQETRTTNASWGREDVAVWVDGERYRLLGTLQPGGVLNDGGSFRVNDAPDEHRVSLVFSVPRGDELELELCDARHPLPPPAPRKSDTLADTLRVEIAEARLRGPIAVSLEGFGPLRVRPMSAGGQFLGVDLTWTPTTPGDSYRFDPKRLSVHYGDGAWATCAITGSDADTFPRPETLTREGSEPWPTGSLTCWFAVAADIGAFSLGYDGAPLAPGTVGSSPPGRRKRKAD